jgi:hypothetical protein
MLAKNRLLVHEMNSQLETPLHVAIKMQKSRKLCAELVKAGADLYHLKDL